MILITCSNYVPHFRNADRTDQSQGLKMECEKKINKEDTRLRNSKGFMSNDFPSFIFRKFWRRMVIFNKIAQNFKYFNRWMIMILQRLKYLKFLAVPSKIIDSFKGIIFKNNTYHWYSSLIPVQLLLHVNVTVHIRWVAKIYVPTFFSSSFFFSQTQSDFSFSQR